MNFRNFGNDPPGDGGSGGLGGRPSGIFPLVRQSSVYSLTFDEFQSAMGGPGKDFGSMNMDELLKNIWTAEETQATTSTIAVAGQDGGVPGGGYLQRQGSLTLPRTLSQKTVDEVWRDMSRELAGGGKDHGSDAGGSNLPPRQQTLGEITLEEFLVRAGVVREEVQPPGRADHTGFFGNSLRQSNSSAMGIGFPPTGQSGGLVGNRNQGNNNQTSIQSSKPLIVNGGLSSQQQQQQLFPKQLPLAHANPTTSPIARAGIVGISDQLMNNSFVQGGGMGLMGLGAGAVTVAAASPAVSSDGIGRSNGDMSSVSPVPYSFNGGLRGRRSNNAVEKVVERRQRRMIKNRESAARSRARKQAYTMELEAEVAKLKEENQELQKRQEEIIETQKNQIMEMMKMQQGGKRQCLRRTQTGPW
nr:basic leucine-zipper transcription factor [Diospyros kaki]